jgi:tetratricopeptide (TPR) repeat protein
LTQADPESGWLRGWVPYWFVLTRAYHEGGEYERELEAVDRWRQLHPETPEMLRAELRTLAALGRIEELSARVLGAIQRGQPMGGWSRELRAHGYPAAASDLAGRTLEWFDQTSDWRQDPRQFLAYGRFLSQAGRWDEAQAVLEEMLRAVPQHNDAALELAYVLASQGYRDQAFRAVGLTRGSDDLIVRAWVEAALGERERAMELLRENGYTPRMQGLHGLASMSRFSTLWDYPPFQEFTRPQG